MKRHSISSVANLIKILASKTICWNLLWQNKLIPIQIYYLTVLYVKNTLILRTALLTMIGVLDHPGRINNCDIWESVTSIKTVINNHASKYKTNGAVKINLIVWFIACVVVHKKKIVK